MPRAKSDKIVKILPLLSKMYCKLYLLKRGGVTKNRFFIVKNDNASIPSHSSRQPPQCYIINLTVCNNKYYLQSFISKPLKDIKVEFNSPIMSVIESNNLLM